MGTPGKKEPFVLICALCVLFSIWFFYFVHVPLLESSAQLEDETKKLSEEIIAIENFSNGHPNLREYAADIARQREMADRALPDRMEESAVISLLQQHALQQQTRLVSIIPGQLQREQDLLMLPIQLRLDCNYFQLLDFLNAIQSDDRFLRINRLAAHSKDGKIAFEVEAIIYAVADSARQETVPKERFLKNDS